MRETSLVLPIGPLAQKTMVDIESALMQTVTPFRVVVASAISSGPSVDVARNIKRRTESADLSWFLFDLILRESRIDAIQAAMAPLRSDCVVMLDHGVRIPPDWAGAASVALYSSTTGTVLHGDGAVAFNSTLWPSLSRNLHKGCAKEIIEAASRVVPFRMGELRGSYVLG